MGDNIVHWEPGRGRRSRTTPGAGADTTPTMPSAEEKCASVAVKNDNYCGNSDYTKTTQDEFFNGDTYIDHHGQAEAPPANVTLGGTRAERAEIRKIRFQMARKLTSMQANLEGDKREKDKKIRRLEQALKEQQLENAALHEKANNTQHKLAVALASQELTRAKPRSVKKCARTYSSLENCGVVKFNEIEG